MNLGIYTPCLLPNEHIYGYVSRTILLNTAQNKYSVQAALAAENRALLATPSFQPIMQTVVNYLSEHFGLPCEQIYRKHSMLGFYRHAMDCGTLTQLLRGKIRKDIYQPGTKSFKTTKWRFCPACIEADRGMYGTDYWHVEHQLPTSLTCHIHEDVLLVPASGAHAHGCNDLRITPRPSDCKSVASVLHAQKLELTPSQRWMQKAGLELYNDDSKFVDSRYKYAVLYEVPWRYSSMYPASSRQRIFVDEKANEQFLIWLKDNKVDALFADDTDITTLKSARIDRLRIKPRYAPVGIHLLWLQFLGAKTVGDAYRDVSSANIA
jgi:hypothetical protein